MQQRKLNDKELDRIAKVLMSSTAFRPGDIEKIVVDPTLFNRVRTRIHDVQSTSSTRPYAVYSFIRRNAAAVSGVLFISIAAISFGVFRTKPATTANVATSTPKTVERAPTEVKKFDKPDQEFVPRPIQASVERTRPSRVPVSRVSSVKTSEKPSSMTVDGGDFYALSFAGDPNETERGGRIIRVDMPRSALFAMGVNIPLENDAEVVKADLLIGNDGVTRAIRVVE